VDDEQVILTSLHEQLRGRFGRRYLYESAMSGEEALEVIDELVEEGVQTVVVVSDWLMPGMRGDELLARVHSRHPRTIKVMLTGQADPEALARARSEAQVSGLFHKPWSREELLSLIEAQLVAQGEGGA
jgi:CheY-like chemotaxis protein